YSAPSTLSRPHGRRRARRRGDRARPRAFSASRSSTDGSELWKRAGCSRKLGAGAGGILVHLLHQRVHAGKFQLLADEADEGDVERLAIKVSLEVEQEDFQEWRAVVEGRATAEARDAVEAFKVTADPHGIDAMLQPAIIVEPDVGGGIAEFAA